MTSGRRTDAIRAEREARRRDKRLAKLARRQGRKRKG